MNYSLYACVPLCLLLNACDSSTGAAAVQLSVVGGSDQIGGTGAPLTDSVRVQLTAGGRALTDVEVTWHVVIGGGDVAPRVMRTDAAGIASASWRLGLDEGAQVLVASSRFGSVSIAAAARFQFADVTAGYRHTCALTTAGAVYCWGWNDFGQLGRGEGAALTQPAKVSGEARFAKVTAGWTHSCGLGLAGDLYCWGDNSSAQLGTNGPNRGFTPTAIASNQSFIDVSAGYLHSCAVSSNGDVFCWGFNGYGQIGGTSDQTVPTRIASGIAFARVTTGEFHTCALSVSGSAYCWGDNGSEQLGIPQLATSMIEPTALAGHLTFSSIAAGARHTCAIGRTDGAAHCWGRNFYGEIGRPPSTGSAVPNRVPGNGLFTTISAGNAMSCAIATDVFCWGSDLDASASVPRRKLLGATAVSVGFEHACAVVDGRVWCWGSNRYGQLGVPGIRESAAPVKVTGIP